MQYATPEQKQRFIDLTAQLSSPENLACDGEASPTEVKRRLQQIKKEWKALEAACKMYVTQDMVTKWMAGYEAFECSHQHARWMLAAHR